MQAGSNQGYKGKYNRLCFLIMAFVTAPVLGQITEEVVVEGDRDYLPITAGSGAALLRKEGVQFYSAGGVAQLPVLRGMNDDRVKVLIDGAEVTAACANHMNPALSYIDASRINHTEVIAGITPVSLGGDSIAGTLVVDSEAPHYSDSPDKLRRSAYVAAVYKSNNSDNSWVVNGAIASDSFSAEYTGTQNKAESYKDGNGDKVLDTLYRTESHNLTLGMRGENNAAVIKFNHQSVPYQGFPNQYMDMVGDISNSVNLSYVHGFNWGQLDTRLTWQDVSHKMGFFTDEKTGTMPMNTKGKDIGYQLKATLSLSEQHTVRAGHEYHGFALDDWWPAVAGSMMMGPNDYVNINNGERNRLALWAESEYQLTPALKTLVGLRYEQVITNTGDVQPYNTMASMMMPNLDAPAAVAFNSRDRKQTDNNVDFTLSARYEAKPTQSVEFGYARKTRTPNLYERYTWGRNTMAMTMIGWFGDGNAYVGNIDLKPEIAHTVAVTLNWKSAQEGNWAISAAPYYSYVDDYVDVQQVGTFNPRGVMWLERPRLQTTNNDATFYGIEVKALRNLWENNTLGKADLKSQLAYTRGKRKNSEYQDLYQIMPLTFSLAVEQSRNNWYNTIELEWVDDKTAVDQLRQENTTASYLLVNAGTRITLGAFTISADLNNLFDKYYELPLGGVSIAQWRADGMTGTLDPLRGQGRSLDLGVRYQF